MQIDRDRFLFHKDQNESALNDCNEALRLNPTYLKALVRRAQLFEDLDKPHESMNDYQEVLKLDPRNIQAKVAVETVNVLNVSIKEVLRCLFVALTKVEYVCIIR